MKNQIAVALAVLAFADAGWCQSADEIIANVQKKYAGLTSLVVTGKAVSDMDMSGVPASDLVMTNIPKTPELEAALQKRQTLTTTFTIRLARPNLYRIEWEQVYPAPGQFTNRGAVWSAGDGNYLLLGGNQQSKQDDMNLALASATGVSGGAAGTLPPIFFESQMDLLKNLKNTARPPEEKIGNDACYVVSGDVAGMKLVLWITKDFLLKQKRQILGSALAIPKTSDADIKKTLEQLNQSATPEAIEQMKTSMQRMQAMSSKIKGSLTETYEKVELNPSLKKEAFAAPAEANR
jgi:hypothetical protein